jgi:hypothetical protein
MDQWILVFPVLQQQGVDRESHVHGAAELRRKKLSELEADLREADNVVRIKYCYLEVWYAAHAVGNTQLHAVHMQCTAASSAGGQSNHAVQVPVGKATATFNQVHERSSHCARYQVD